MNTHNEITLLLNSKDLSQSENINQLFDLLYSEIKKIAANQLQKLNPDNALSPTVLVNECYLKLNMANNLNLRNRKHFFCIAAKCMRYYLMDLLKGNSRQKRDGINTVLSLTKLSEDEDINLELTALDDALKELEQIDPELSQIVELRFYWGFTLGDVAEIFETKRSKVYQQWLMAKSLLLNLIQEQ